MQLCIMYFQEHNDREMYDALTTEELLGSQGDDDLQSDRNTSIEEGNLNSMSEVDKEALLGQLSTLQTFKRSTRLEEEQLDDAQSGFANFSRAGFAPSSSPPHSPLLKKFASIQECRVNTVLLEALHLSDISRDEIGLIERSMKRLNDAVLGFAMLVDNQEKILAISSAEDCNRIKADIETLSCQLKASNALIESTSERMKKHLKAGRNQLEAHRRRLLVKQGAKDFSESESTHICGSIHRKQDHCLCEQLQDGAGISPMDPADHTPPRDITGPPAAYCSSQVPLAWILKPRPIQDKDVEVEAVLTGMISPDLFASVLNAAELQDPEFLELKSLKQFLHGVLAFLIARNPTLKLMDKAFHRRLLPEYVNQLADALVLDMQLVPQLLDRSGVVTPVNALKDYVCMKPYRFDRLLQNVHVSPTIGKDVSSSGCSVPPPFEAKTTARVSLSPVKKQVTRNPKNMNSANEIMTKSREPKTIECAGQTLGMAKLLHNLATAECEARNGNRMSIRAPVPHAKEFSKAYIASSKELMWHEIGFEQRSISSVGRVQTHVYKGID